MGKHQEHSPESLSGHELSAMALQIDSLLAVVEDNLQTRQEVGQPPEGAVADGLCRIIESAREKAKYLYGALDSIETYGATPAGG